MVKAKTTKKKNKKVVGEKRKTQVTTKKEIKIESIPAQSKRTAEYLEFITFIAIPRVLQKELLGVDSQDAFAKKYALNKNTLIKWKKRAGFYTDVMRVKQDFFRERTSDVILSLETTCLKDGKGSDVKVLLTYTGEYKERQEMEHTVDPEVAKAIDNINKFVIPD